MSSLLIALLLIAIGLLLLGIDLLIPSGGILIVLAAIVAMVGVGFGFHYSTNVGGWLTVFVLAMIPVALVVFVRVYPHTSIGKKMIIQRPTAAAFDYGEQTDSNSPELIGKIGIAKTDLRPSGKIMINNKVLEATSSCGILEAGTAIRVVDLEMGLATVELYYAETGIEANVLKPVENMPASTENAVSQADPISESSESGSSLLEMSPEEFGLDSFEIDDSEKKPPLS